MSIVAELPLVSTIAIGLSTAFVCGFIASKFKLSPLVGYIIAGIIIGPYSPGYEADIHIAEQLSEIGIALLLFGVGLHFSVSDFMEVRKIAGFGALARIGIVVLAGIGIADFWGWSLSTGVLFGLALSVASTVVLLRVLEDAHLVKTIVGKISIGWLIVEDVAMVLALVIIPALAASSIAPGPGDNPLWMQILIAFGKVGLFAAIMVIVGRRVLPWLLTAVSRTGSRELFTLAAISMAMGIAFGAAILFGVSIALGAFFAGMMIRESDLNHEVADRVLPFQDAFAVLFFVSVGMLFNPSVMIEEPGRVLVVALMIIVGKAIITFLIMMTARYPLRTSLKVAVGLAQIGEFSFILLALGTNLHLIDKEAGNLILAGALISIALNPLLFLYCQKWVAKHCNMAASDDDKLAHLDSSEKAVLKNLIVLIGHGRVGHSITQMMNFKKNDLVIIDENREKVEQLRREGYHAIVGNATQMETLIEAGIEKAHTVMITVPDPFDARRIVEHVQNLKPGARLLVRSHNEEETAFLQQRNVELLVSGTEEIARRMVSHLS